MAHDVDRALGGNRIVRTDREGVVHALVVGAVLVAGAQVRRLLPLLVTAAVAGACWWFGLAASGLEQATDNLSFRGLWAEGHGLPLLAAALLRLVLAARDAGMLAVRNRFFDAFLLTGAGVALIVLASSIPPQPVI